MKSNIITIMQKEFARFFGDKRMLFMILLPGVMIYVIYSFMGTALSDMFTPDSNYKPIVYAVHMPESLRAAVTSLEFDIRDLLPEEIESIKEKIASQEADLCLVFPQNFESSVADYDVFLHSTPAPNIEVYFNAVDTNSAAAYSNLIAFLDAYESSLANKFDINRDVTKPNLATDVDTSASIISSMMPMLLMMFLYTGCMSIAPESIAGEKERGTIATLLATPLGRAELAIGKILSLAVLSFLTGLVSAIATILSLPKLMISSPDVISVGIYGPEDYLLLALVILSTILLLVSIIAVISAFARTVKEAGTAVAPVMIVVMLVGVLGMFSSSDQILSPPLFLIPLFNSVKCMSGIFSLDYSPVNILIACFSNLFYACIGGFVLTRMFNSEKIMFPS